MASNRTQIWFVYVESKQQAGTFLYYREFIGVEAEKDAQEMGKMLSLRGERALIMDTYVFKYSVV